MVIFLREGIGFACGHGQLQPHEHGFFVGRGTVLAWKRQRTFPLEHCHTFSRIEEHRRTIHAAAGSGAGVFTKETLIMNATAEALFDNFYLGWALDLDVVRKQWGRVVFMQTNREDLGNRYREILIPIPDTRTWRISVEPLPSILSLHCTVPGEVLESARIPEQMML